FEAATGASGGFEPATGAAVGGFEVTGGGAEAAAGVIVAGWAPVASAWGGVVAGATSNESGQLGITASGMSEGIPGSVMFADGGHAGIALSVGGSGGQMSVSAGGAVAFSSAGGQVLPAASLATAFGVSVIDAVVDAAPATGESVGWGTVCAQTGASFGSGTAGLASVVVGGSVCVQAGSPFCIGLAGSGSASAAVLRLSGASGGTTGTVRAQTGTVSRVETAATGSSGAVLLPDGVDSCGVSGCDSKTRSV
ncbi:MAG: hypothetical protein WCC30_06525, partial [Candidatus Dormiibacterota bacterium]